MMKKYKLGSLLKVRHGFAFKSANYVKSSDVALVTLANFSENNNFKFNIDKTTFYGAKYPEAFNLKEGDLVMPLTEQVVGLFGNTAFIPKIKNFQFVLNQRVGKIEHIDKLIDKYYLHYLLATNSVRDQLEYRASGTKQRNIGPEDIYDVTVYIHDLPQQRVIGKALYNYENIIENNNKIIEELNMLLNTVYEYWFIKFDFPDVDGNPYKTSGGKMTHDDSINISIPKDWTVKRVKDYLNVKTGKQDANFSKPNGKYPFFTCSREILSCDEYEFDSPAVLLAGNGDFNVKFYDGKFNAYQRTYVLEPHRKKDLGILYISVLRSIEMLKNQSAGSIIKYITLRDVEDIIVLDPKNDFLLDTLNKILYSILEKEKENKELLKLQGFLLHKLINGQVKIS